MLRLPRKLLPLLTLLALSGCLGGSGEDEPVRIEGGSATVYMSLPRHGVSAPAAQAVAAGARLALADAGGRAGGLRIGLRSLDASVSGEGPWTPDSVNANAERAAGDPRAIAYLGELDFGASAISLPITNARDMLQVSPEDGLTSLTATPPGRPRSLPERLRPEGEPSFVRLVPSDLLEVETLLELMRSRGTERMAVVFDQEVYGRELAAQLLARGRRDGIEVVGSEEYRGEVEEIPDLVRGLAGGPRPDAVVYAGVAGPGTGRLLAALDQRLPGVPVYGTSGLLTRDPEAPVPLAPASVEALGSVPPADRLPPAGRRLVRRVARSAGPRAARSEAVYGYEAMRLILDAIDMGGRERAAVTRAALAMRDRRSPLGPYRLRGTGDVESTRFALYSLRDGRFRYVRSVG